MNGQSTAVWLLSLGQTLTYAGVMYAFPALLPDLIAHTGWGVADLAFGPTLGYLVMAALMALSGRLLDQGYGPLMMVIGPILAALCLVGLGMSQSLWQWNLYWIILGAAQAGCVYETCFALLTRRLGYGARAAITRVTLIAGFASTLAFPLGHWLGGAYGGQGGLIAFAGIVGLAGLVNFAAVRLLRDGAPISDTYPVHGRHLAGVLAKPVFWAILAIFTVLGLNHAMLLTYVLVLFDHQGASVQMATLAAACIGPSQVVARLILLRGEARISNGTATLWALGAVVVAGGLLFLAGIAPQLIFAFALFQGAGAGLLSILRPVLISDHLGRAGFGAISGAVSVGPILAAAAAPSVGAGLLGWGGPDMVFGAGLALASLGMILGFWVLQKARV